MMDNRSEVEFDGALMSVSTIYPTTFGDPISKLSGWQENAMERRPSTSPDAVSLTSTQPAQSTRNALIASGAADIFSPEIFQIVLHNPTTSHQLLRYSQSRFCGENMEFLEKVDRCNTLLDELTKTMSDIYRSFTSPEAPRQLNLSAPLMKRMNMDIKQTTSTTLPAMELIFSDAQDRVEGLLAADVYPRFVKHQMTLNAEKALASGRGKYGGLGDCFCLTDPAKADNPIVYASDGFVKVTGYSRTDIVPRNCRFLQGKYTDQAASRRIKEAIMAKQESVELLLNYRKNGEPFWNLLYVAPLFNSEGKVAFFLGGQINCSTTVHSRADILKVLSMSDEVDEDNDADFTATKENAPPIRKGFFSAFRSRSSNNIHKISHEPAGMEQELINKIENYSFKNQMKMFYTAYSKYLVLSSSTLNITFFSAGVLEMLLIDPATDTTFLSTDIFKVLTPYSNSVTKDFKSRIKNSLKMGRAVSADMNLATRRSVIMRGSEQFATHWTPLKNEGGATKFVIVLFAPVAQDW